MKCPKCGVDNNKVKDSRNTNLGNTWRLRKCSNCGEKFETLERYTENTEFDFGRNFDYHHEWYLKKRKIKNEESEG